MSGEQRSPWEGGPGRQEPRDFGLQDLARGPWWPGVAIGAIIAFTVGLGAGFVVSSIQTPSYRKVVEELDAIRSRLGMTQSELAAAKLDAAQLSEELVGVRGELSETLVFLRYARKALRESHYTRAELAVDQLKAMALLGALMKQPEIAEALRAPLVQDRFRPRWYWPEKAFAYLGNYWVLDEMIECGAIGNTEVFDTREMSWPSIEQFVVEEGLKTTDPFSVSSPSLSAAVVAFP